MGRNVMNMTRRAVMAGFVFATLLHGWPTLAEQGSAAQPASTPLVIYGAKMAVELGPIHLAVRRLYPAGTVIHNGGVVNLVGKDRRPTWRPTPRHRRCANRSTNRGCGSY